MHEFSELVQVAAPVASLGGIAVIVRAARARGARRLRKVTGVPVERPGEFPIATRGFPEREDHHGRIHNA